MTLQQRQAELDATCTGYGFARGTTEYKQCWMQIDQANQRAAAAAMNSQVVCSHIGTVTVCQ
ncbi:MAG: hypothetical protein V4641_03400 [Pseudomonadota bacterium]